MDGTLLADGSWSCVDWTVAVDGSQSSGVISITSSLLKTMKRMNTLEILPVACPIITSMWNCNL